MILALDPGFKNTGWILIDKGVPIRCGCIQTEKTTNKRTKVSDDDMDRIAHLASELKDICDGNDVKGIVAELPTSGAKSARALKAMSFAGSTVMSVATVLNLPVEWISPTDSKLAFIGKRKGGKDEVMNKVREVLPDFEWPKTKGKFEHIADAWSAYYGLRNGLVAKTFF